MLILRFVVLPCCGMDLVIAPWLWKVDHLCLQKLKPATYYISTSYTTISIMYWIINKFIEIQKHHDVMDISLVVLHNTNAMHVSRTSSSFILG